MSTHFPQNHSALSTTFTRGRPAAKRRALSMMTPCRASSRDGPSAATCGVQKGIRRRPQWVIGRQRLDLVDVEAGAGNHALSNRRSSRSSSFVVMPRPILMKNADGFISRNRAVLNRPSVLGVCGTVTITKSARGRRLSRDSGRCNSPTPAGASAARRIDTDHLHIKRSAEPRCFGSDTPDADDERNRAWKVYDSSRIPRVPSMLPLPLLVDMHSAREHEDVGKDVRGNAIGKNPAQVRHRNGVGDQLRIVVARGGRGLRAPAATSGAQLLSRSSRGSVPKAASAAAISRFASSTVARPRLSLQASGRGDGPRDLVGTLRPRGSIREAEHWRIIPAHLCAALRKNPG